jgi:hypothetical protein
MRFCYYPTRQSILLDKSNPIEKYIPQVLCFFCLANGQLWPAELPVASSGTIARGEPLMTDSYLVGDEFPIVDGERMCPRCMCCSVGVGSYDPPQALPGPRFTSLQIIPTASSLRHEPGPSSGTEAWYCSGGCDKKGEHSHSKSRAARHPPAFPTFIAYVKKAEPSRSGRERE